VSLGAVLLSAATAAARAVVKSDKPKEKAWCGILLPCETEARETQEPIIPKFPLLLAGCSGEHDSGDVGDSVDGNDYGDGGDVRQDSSDTYDSYLDYMDLQLEVETHPDLKEVTDVTEVTEEIDVTEVAEETETVNDTEEDEVQLPACLQDEDFGSLCSVGIGECKAPGVLVCSEDMTELICSATPYLPIPETCDNKDNNCNNIIDDENVCLTSYYCDNDNDSFFNQTSNGSCNFFGCVPNDCTNLPGNDCVDLNELINPSANDPCDGIDNNCNGQTDEGFEFQCLQSLKVSGETITNQEGETISLKGIALNNLYWETDPQMPNWILSKEDFEMMNSWGANTVRYAVSYTWFEDDSQPFVYKEKGFEDLEKHISWAKENGIYIIIDMHRAQGGIQDSGEGDALWLNPENQQRLISLWQEFAIRYNDESTIAAFELLNEPHPPEDEDWQIFATELAASIREFDQNHMLVVCNTLITNDNDWSKLPFTPFTIPDNNVLYTAHFYEPGHFTHQGAVWAGVPQGANWPDTVIDFEKEFVYVGGYYNNPGFFQDTNWAYIEGNWAEAPPEATIGQIAFSSEHEMGKVWIDDILVEEKGPDNQIKVIDLENTDFSDPLYKDLLPWQDYSFDEKSYYPSFWSFSDIEKVRFDNEEGNNAPGSVVLDGCTNQCKAETRILNNYFPVSPGHQYKVSGYVKAQGLAPLSQENWDWNMFMINYFKAQTMEWDKQYIQTKLGFYADWAKNNGVPFYLGEFGAIALAPADDDLTYVEDTIQVIEENNMHWTYFALRGNLPYPLSIELISGDSEDPNQHIRQDMIDLLNTHF